MGLREYRRFHKEASQAAGRVVFTRVPANVGFQGLTLIHFIVVGLPDAGLTVCAWFSFTLYEPLLLTSKPFLLSFLFPSLLSGKTES